MRPRNRLGRFRSLKGAIAFHLYWKVVYGSNFNTYIYNNGLN